MDWPVSTAHKTGESLFTEQSKCNHTPAAATAPVSAADEDDELAQLGLISAPNW